MNTNEPRTIGCPNCGGIFEGDWTGADCRTCGHFVVPTAAADMADLLLPGEVVRLSRTGTLVAVTPEATR